MYKRFQYAKAESMLNLVRKAVRDKQRLGEMQLVLRISGKESDKQWQAFGFEISTHGEGVIFVLAPGQIVDV